ncbi:hypothetical protein [Streptomyces sp. t39]|uniref:hypothetical protein n=1 Tax=Streptomyces sp. t39 TaxID=1828156 RepID=UPI0011CDCF8D|nr:hypothetical protein [Streptomyces sp. t39]TXS56480.1 hypothetical protein EAO77_10410 [Streptomyces sp. t39]
MPASERAAQSAQPRQPSPSAGSSPSPAPLSMRDLLASCAAASAVSTPPRDVPRAPVRHGDRTPRQDAA